MQVFLSHTADEINHLWMCKDVCRGSRSANAVQSTRRALELARWFITPTEAGRRQTARGLRSVNGPPIRNLPHCQLYRSNQPSSTCSLVRHDIHTIDREFEFYEFFPFLKFNEFYSFFSVEKIAKNS